MKKALIINGSPHRNGTTARLLKMIEERIQKDYEVENVSVYSSFINPCIGCLKCRHDGECILPEDMGHIIGRKITQADLIIIGSPSYWGNVTAPLKALFDRNVMTFEHFNNGIPAPRLMGKKAIIAVTNGSAPPLVYDSTQSKGVIRAIETVMIGGGIEIEKVINVAQSWDINNQLESIQEEVNSISL